MVSRSTPPPGGSSCPASRPSWSGACSAAPPTPRSKSAKPNSWREAGLELPPGGGVERDTVRAAGRAGVAAEQVADLVEQDALPVQGGGGGRVEDVVGAGGAHEQPAGSAFGSADGHELDGAPPLGGQARDEGFGIEGLGKGDGVGGFPGSLPQHAPRPPAPRCTRHVSPPSRRDPTAPAGSTRRRLRGYARKAR